VISGRQYELEFARLRLRLTCCSRVVLCKITFFWRARTDSCYIDHTFIDYAKHKKKKRRRTCGHFIPSPNNQRSRERRT
jgi:hypothetical protein